MNENIKPLPLGEPLNAATAAAAAEKKPDQLSLDDRVTEWADAHPEGQDFDPNASAPPATEQQPAPRPSGESAPPAESKDQAKPKTEVPPAAPPADAKPQAKEPAPQEPPPQVKPAEPKPAEPQRFSLDAQYSFAEGSQPWTGQQIVDGLRERQALIPKAQEADSYLETFGMPAAQAKELWAPNIAWMRQNPQAVQMIADMIDDPMRAAYLMDCSKYWDSDEGRNLRAQNPRFQAAQKPPAMSPEVEARFKQLEAQNKQLLEAEATRKKQVYMDRIGRDLNVAFQRYPYLRDNPEMVKALLARAYWINGGDDSENAKGVLDALEMERDLYDAKLAALDTAKQIADGAAAPPPAPPLLGSAGAAPTATQPRNVAQPRKFESLDDAVDEWISHPPQQFR